MTILDWNNTKLNAQADEVARSLDRLAKGDLAGPFPADSALAKRLSPAIHTLQDQLVRQRAEGAAFVNALAALTKAHAAGAIDTVIDADTLAEPYRSIAQQIDGLVKSHIDVKMQVVNVVSRYAEGDFSVAMDRLPGKKAQITEAVDRAKRSFQAVSTQAAESTKFIAALAEMNKRHQLGWIDETIPLDAFAGGYREAADLVNCLVRSHIDVKLKIVDVISKCAAGDFSMPMDRLPGKKAQITEAIDRAKATFEMVAMQAVESDKFIAALGEMTEQHALGWIDEKIPAAAFSGSFKNAADLVNRLVRSHIDVKMKVVDVITKYAHADFSVEMDRLPGKKAQITAAMDQVRAMLRAADSAVKDVTRVLGALAHGDLTETITADYEGAIGQLKTDFNATVASLTRTIVEMRAAAEIVRTSACEISDGNTDLAQRTEVQAASLEQTAASMDQLTTTVHGNAANAKQANLLTIGASNIAIRGGQVVGEVVATMAAINASAQRIGDIIGVIDGIAFQTNILALNAAVEAARAGEQGRGFAVVAGEVRTLAQRSAAAAKEIKGLVGDSIDKTATGTKLVDQAGATMAEIVASVKRVTDIMAAIYSASQEQASGIEQINGAINQMDQVTQQNAALVEEVAVSAAMLQERAESLVELVRAFTLPPSADRMLSETPSSPNPTRTFANLTKRKPRQAPSRSGRRAAAPEANLDADWAAF